jgi:predicted permease
MRFLPSRRPEDIWRDIAYGARTLRRNPAFSAAVILTLALGIGANTAVFSVVNGVLLRPLPYEAAERQVELQVLNEPRTGPPQWRPLNLTAADTMEIAQRSRAFAHVGNVGMSLSNWRGREPRWSGAAVTASVFGMLGVSPVLGRSFVPDDEHEGAPGVMILSYGAWQRHFGGDRGVLGRVITVEPGLMPAAPDSSRAYTVVGVAPSGFDYFPGSEAQYWIPLRRSARGAVVARLSDGVSTTSAATEVEPILRDLQRRTSGPRPLGYRMIEVQQQLVAPVKRPLLILMGAVGFVLLIACVNVGNLLLVRSVARRRELAIRAAIGASQSRIVRLLILESVLLTGIAAILGVAFAGGGVQILRWLATTADRIDLGQRGGKMIPRLDAVSVDGTVLAFTVAVSAAVAILFGIISSAQHRQLELPALRNNPSAIAASTRRRSRQSAVRGLLIVAQISLSIVLLVGGGLLIASFVRLLRVDVGYDPEKVLTFQVSLPSERYPLPRLRSFAEDFVATLESQPHITHAAYAKQLPLVQLRDTLAIGRTPDTKRGEAATTGDVRLVSRAYFATMRIPLLAGRTFEERDGAEQPRVLVINEALARRDFGGSANAPGHQVYVAGDTTPWNIIGVVADVRQFGLAAAGGPQFFIDARQWEKRLSPLFPLSPYYTLRFEGDQSSAIAAVRSVLAQMEAEAVVFNVATMGTVISTTVARPRMYAVLLGVFAISGLTMALVGIYGVVSYSVSQRTRELGIRMALGARPVVILGLVLRHSLILTAAGIILGMLGAAALTGILETMLFELTPLDPATFVIVPLLFALFAAVAAYVPARRATLVDPLVALRTE